MTLPSTFAEQPAQEPVEPAPWHPAGDGLPTYQEIISRDRVPPAADSIVRQVTFEVQSDDDIPKERYYSLEFARQEVEHVWKKTWQPVCHESQLAAPGDVFVYDVAGVSALVTRVDEHQIRAYHNSCLHRGTRFRSSSGSVEHFRCPYHGFTWKLDGTLDSLPCEWDFAHVDKESFCLPELQVDTWAGFVFVNPDPEARSLAEYLGVITEHFRPWRVENRVVTAHVTKPIRANWKVVLEAFLEVMHVYGVHKQMLPRTSDSNTQYDIFWPHCSRFLTASNLPSPHLAGSDEVLSEQDIVDRVLKEDFLGIVGEGVDLSGFLGQELAAVFAGMFKDSVPEDMFKVPKGVGPFFLAEFARTQVRALTGDTLDAATLSDAEVGDGIEYSVFPNLSLLGGYSVGLVFWIRPLDPDDPQTCLLELFMLRPGSGRADDRTEAAKVYHLTEEDSIRKVTEMAGVATLFDQDLRNFPRVQRGLRTAVKPGVTLASYSERRIRHFHTMLDRYMEQPAQGGEGS